jgi:hypothetical protein
MFNISYKRVGRLSFLKIGRLTLSWSIASEYRAFMVNRFRVPRIQGRPTMSNSIEFDRMTNDQLDALWLSAGCLWDAFLPSA